MTQKLTTKRPIGVMIAVASLVLLAATSIAGGKVLLDDPSGKAMGIQFLATYMPFNLHDFFAVGVWLVAVYGVVPLILAPGLWLGKRWAWIGTLALGAVVVTWILSEVIMFYSFGFVFFYPLIGGTGALMIIMMALPSTRIHFKAAGRTL